jgi:hypothetical protein
MAVAAIATAGRKTAAACHVPQCDILGSGFAGQMDLATKALPDAESFKISGCCSPRADLPAIEVP